jgi:thioredoxin 1
MGKYLVDLRNSNQINYFDFLTLNSKGCVVDFYADWCGPCKQLGSQLESAIAKDSVLMENLLSLEDKSLDSLTKDDVKDKVVLLKINIDEFKDLTEQFKIQSIPHVVYYKNGELQSKVPGVCSKVLSVVSSLC